MLTDEAKLTAEVAVGLAKARSQQVTLSRYDFEQITEEAIKLVKRCTEAFPPPAMRSLPAEAPPPKGGFPLIQLDVKIPEHPTDPHPKFGYE
jgi:hypothetical protein